MEILLVISRYNEELEWIDYEAVKKYKNIIYNKGSNNNFKKNKNTLEVINIPNVGREGHTYLYHIINNYYNNLHDVIVFLPASIDSSNDKLMKIVHILENLENGIISNHCTKYNNVKTDLYDFQLDNWSASDPKNIEINPEMKLELSKIRPFGKWFESHFGDMVIINEVYYCGIFAVHKNTILYHPLSYYEELMKELSLSSNPEAGHYFERSWGAIFTTDYKNV